MLRILLKSVAISVGLGSFIFLLNGVFGTIEVIQTKEIISVWAASAIIGVVSSLYQTKIADSIVTVIQFVVGITAFTTIALVNGWVSISSTDVLFYAGVTFVIMLVIFIAFYFLSMLDSKRINDKLNEK